MILYKSNTTNIYYYVEFQINDNTRMDFTNHNIFTSLFLFHYCFNNTVDPILLI